MQALRLLVLAGAAMAVSGCGIFELWGEGTQTSRPFSNSTRTRLWQHVKEVVNNHWRLKDIREDEYYLQTEWEVHLGPMYKSGLRRQVNAWVHDSANGPYFEVQVLREINVNIKNPLNEPAADWEDDGRDRKQEERILYEVQASLDPPTATDRVGEGPKDSKWKGRTDTEDPGRAQRDLWKRRPKR